MVAELAPRHQLAAAGDPPAKLDARVGHALRLTRSNRIAACYDSRTQPCDAGRPIEVWLVPWMAWPCVVKKIELGIGASSHSRLKWSFSMRNGVNCPPGVS